MSARSKYLIIKLGQCLSLNFRTGWVSAIPIPGLQYGNAHSVYGFAGPGADWQLSDTGSPIAAVRDTAESREPFQTDIALQGSS